MAVDHRTRPQAEASGTRWPTAQSSKTTCLAVFLLLSMAAGSFARAPVPVSPDGLAAEACPTFSWSAVPGASGYELVAHAVTAEGEIDDQPTLLARLPGGALSWTPPADRCLEPGRFYAWWVRAESEEEERSEWSEAAVVEIAARPSITELEAAIATVERYLAATETGGSEIWGDRVERETSELLQARVSPLGAAPRRDALSRDHAMPGVGADRLSLVATSEAKGPPRMTVDGEIRTVGAEGNPQLWGKGREGVTVGTVVLGPCTNGDIKFGLSLISVDWGSAASACPAGTRVCEITELIPCNTGRGDDDADAIECDGDYIDFPADDHLGWTEDLVQSVLGQAYGESGSRGARSTCTALPVWCCWE